MFYYWKFVFQYLTTNECMIISNLSNEFNYYIKNKVEHSLYITQLLTDDIFNSILKLKKVINCKLNYNIHFAENNKHYYKKICENWKYVKYLNFNNCCFKKEHLSYISENCKSLQIVTISNTFAEQYIYNYYKINDIIINDICEKISNNILLNSTDSKMVELMNELQHSFNNNNLTSKLSAFNLYLNSSTSIITELILNNKINFIKKNTTYFNFNSSNIYYIIKLNNLELINYLIFIKYQFEMYIWNYVFLFNKDCSILDMFLQENISFNKNDIFNNIFDKFQNEIKIPIYCIDILYKRGAKITSLFIINIVTHNRYDILEWIYENKINISQYFSIYITENKQIYKQNVKYCLMHYITKSQLNINMQKTYDILCKLNVNSHNPEIKRIGDIYIYNYLIEQILQLPNIILSKDTIFNLLDEYKADNIRYISIDMIKFLTEDDWLKYIKLIPSISNAKINNFIIGFYNYTFNTWCYDNNKHLLINYIIALNYNKNKRLKIE